MRRRLCSALAAVTLLLTAACAGSGSSSATTPAAGRTAIAPTVGVAPSQSPAPVPLPGPALTREHLLQWGADCSGAPSTGFWIVCPTAGLPAVDGNEMNAACASLRLANAAPPQANIVLSTTNVKDVSLNCDQGTPRMDGAALEAATERPSGYPWPPVNFASVSVTVPASGTTLQPVPTCDKMQSNFVCHPLEQHQPGTVWRTSVNWYSGPGHPVSVMVHKPSVEVSVQRAYDNNGNQVVASVMLADQKAIVTALNAVDTASGFVPITSTAGCCER